MVYNLMSKVLNKSRVSILEDLVFILYLLPIIIPIVYSLLLWPNMGQETYLKVTREPIVFIIGIISICIAMIIDIKESETNDKLKLLRVNRERIIKLFYSTIILSIIIAWILCGYLIKGSISYISIFVGVIHASFKAYQAVMKKY